MVFSPHHPQTREEELYLLDFPGTLCECMRALHIYKELYCARCRETCFKIKLLLFLLFYLTPFEFYLNHIKVVYNFLYFMRVSQFIKDLFYKLIMQILLHSCNQTGLLYTKLDTILCTIVQLYIVVGGLHIFQKVTAIL